jgi:tetratricopeptide (TPR) repeat protein
MKYFVKLLVLSICACSRLFGQSDPDSGLHDVIRLEQQGRLDEAIRSAKLLIASNQMKGVELARAHIVLGVANQVKGDFMSAQSEFESCLQILAAYPEDKSDYASVLNNYAGLYLDGGQLELASKMWKQALHLSTESGDHTGAMRLLTSLAGLAVSQNRVRQARKYLTTASREAGMVENLAADDSALLAETEAWLDMVERHPSQAVAGYERSLAMSRQAHGDQHWLTGWEHMLLGKAYAQSGDTKRALDHMRQGLEILDQTLGRKNPKYFVALIAYANVLDQVGEHARARQIRADAEHGRKDQYRNQCLSCTINVAAYR